MLDFKPDMTAMLYQTPIFLQPYKSFLLRYIINVRRGLNRQSLDFKPNEITMRYQTPTFLQSSKSSLLTYIIEGDLPGKV